MEKSITDCIWGLSDSSQIKKKELCNQIIPDWSSTCTSKDHDSTCQKQLQKKKIGKYETKCQ